MSTKRIIFLITIISLFFVVGCTTTPAPNPPAEGTPVEIIYNFDQGDQGWKGDFANVSKVNAGTDYNLSFKNEEIPVAGQESKGLMLQGNNVGDMLFMYAYVKVEQGRIESNTDYKIDLSLVLATNVSSNDTDIVENVFVKTGIVDTMPMLNTENDVSRLNIDIGQKGVDSKDLKAIANISKINSEDSSYQYKLLETTFDKTITDNADLYIIIGIETYMKSELKAYFDDVKLKITKK